MSKWSNEKFIKQLEEELEYHKNADTTYNQDETISSLQVNNKLKIVNTFLNPSLAKQELEKHFPYLDNDRAEDITVMLRLIAKGMNMNINENTPEDVKRSVRGDIPKD